MPTMTAPTKIILIWPEVAPVADGVDGNASGDGAMTVAGVADDGVVAVKVAVVETGAVSPSTINRVSVTMSPEAEVIVIVSTSGEVSVVVWVWVCITDEGVIGVAIGDNGDS